MNGSITAVIVNNHFHLYCALTDMGVNGKSILKFLLYFIVGGSVVSLTTYYGSRGQGFTAALISMFPSLTVLTFFLIYKAGGDASVISYAKNLAFGVPPWILYIIAVAMLCEHLGIWLSLTVGVILYLGASFCMSLLR
jgi:uncharacterized membrane protein (GlpM family)